MSSAWPWIAVALLGAYHGLDPSMGWLFAVALGLQEQRRSKVVAALFPKAPGKWGFRKCAGINRHVGVSSEGWRIQWETVPPGQKSEPCSLDSQEEGN